MKKLAIFFLTLTATLSASALEVINRGPDVTKGDYSFMNDNAKMWLYLDFTKAQLVFFTNDNKQKVKESRGLYLVQKGEAEWAKDFEAIYFWTIKYWNVACDKRNIPLHMTADKDSAKYALEFYVDSIDYGWPQVGLIMGEGATLDGTLLVRNLETGETVYEADCNKIKTLWAAPQEVWRIRATLYGAILAPFFLGMDPIGIDVRDNPTLMKYNKTYKPKNKKK